MRPSFHRIYMDLATSMSSRSTCRRLKVGCAITSVDFRKVFAVGYNGNAAGLKNDCDSDEVGACGCLHAEENAVIKCDAPTDAPKIVYCTNLPCLMCAKRLINLGGVTTVIYRDPYRRTESIDILFKVGIRIGQFVPTADSYESEIKYHEK
jgi:dCMP deaminase